MGSCQLDILQPSIAEAILVYVFLFQKCPRQQRKAATHIIWHYGKTAPQQLWDVLDR